MGSPSLIKLLFAASIIGGVFAFAGEAIAQEVTSTVLSGNSLPSMAFQRPIFQATPAPATPTAAMPAPPLAKQPIPSLSGEDASTATVVQTEGGRAHSALDDIALDGGR